MARILVVDDELGVREVLCRYFESRGHIALEASGGRLAVELVKAERPHLVLLDIRMPDMDGIEVLQELKQVDPAVGVIMVTAVGDAAIAREAMKLGAHDYITKPIDLDYLDLAVTTKLIDFLG
ncbi:MAG: response regulator [Nitrospinota bacterium]